MPKPSQSRPASPKRSLQLKDPWITPGYSKADQVSLKAMFHGEATPDQQKHAMEFIVHRCCNRNGMSFYPGPAGELAMALAEGRRFVGNIIMDLVAKPLDKEDTP